MNNRSAFVIVMILQLTIVACSQPAEKFDLPGYAHAKPQVFRMPPVLDEISGITFLNGNADTVYAEQDEEGRLFYFHFGDKEPKHIKFGTNGDYEDVAICSGQIFLLRSDGSFFNFPLTAIHAEEVEATEQDNLLDKGEYEAMYADEKTHQLYVLCKSCKDDKGEKSVTGYTLSVAADGKLTRTGEFSVEDQANENAEKKGRKKFRPSAMAKHPITGEWYIVSSVNKLLVITDANWKLVRTYPLGPVLFNQPEGIAFDKAGNLYISNEMGNAADATIVKFNYQKK
ncbi:MAG TPA: SdiA-regulated domain-containing protein [Chitinophagaceae bacterium]|nr:SdiA-regulated domain-containing protein [Chitinophagaceae bacterium]